MGEQYFRLPTRAVLQEGEVPCECWEPRRYQHKDRYGSVRCQVCMQCGIVLILDVHIEIDSWSLV